MNSPVLSEQRNAESRARITARLREALQPNERTGKTKVEKTSANVVFKPVLPKFVEAVREPTTQELTTKGQTAPFVARARALSCQFLAEGKVANKDTFAEVLRVFFEARRGKKPSQEICQEPSRRAAKKSRLPLLLFDASEKRFWNKLGMLKTLEGFCHLTEVREDVKGTDFIASPFPAFSLQRASCAIAETGTLVFANRTRAQAILTFLPTTHIVLLAEKDIVGSLEQAFARAQPSPSQPALWACHCVSGPSRTADIEQTLHMGAHGPKELCILLYR